MKAIPCKLRLHGSSREHLTEEFKSISEARQWARDCWNRPYTVVKLKPKQNV